MAFMPETARWLLAHNKEKRAERTLKWLRGPNVKIESEIKEIKESLSKYFSVFTFKQNCSFRQNITSTKMNS